MKKLFIPFVVFALTVTAFNLAAARGPMKGGGGCGDCRVATGNTQDKCNRFKQDTLDLRQEMMNKRFNLEREKQRAVQDNAKITALQGEIDSLQREIAGLHEKSGLPVSCGSDCGQQCCQTGHGCNHGAGQGCCDRPCNNQTTLK